MRFDRFIRVVVVLSLALWGIACGGDSGGEDGVDPQGPAATEESSQPLVDDSGLADEPLTSAGGEVSLRPPDGWALGESPRSDAILAAINAEPDEGAEPFTANIIVLNVPPQGLDFEEYVEEFVAGSRQGLTNYAIVEERDAEVGGRPARLIGATYQDGSDVLREQLLLTVVEEGTGYVVSFAALEQRWDDYAELAEASLLSLSTG